MIRLKQRIMKTILSVMLLLLSLTLCGQPLPEPGVASLVDSLLEDAIRRQSGRNDQQAFVNLEHADSLIHVHFGRRSAIFLRLLNIRAFMLSLHKDQAGALAILDAVPPLRDSLGLAGDVEHANELFYRCGILREMGRYAEAEAACLAAVAIHQQLTPEGSVLMVKAQNLLATLLRRSGRMEEAEQVLLPVLDFQTREYGADSPERAFVLYDLGLVYKEKGDYTRAERCYLESLEIRERTLGREHNLYAWSLTGLAGLYKSMRNYPLSEEYYLKALEVRALVRGKTHTDYASTLNNLGGLYVEWNRLEEAAQCLREALDIREKVLGRQHPLYANGVSNLAGVLYSQRKISEALPYFREARRLRQEAGKTADMEYGILLVNESKAAYQLGYFEESEELMKEALALFARDKGHERYRLFTQDMARLYAAWGRWEQATGYFEEGLRMEMAHALRVSPSMTERELQDYKLKLAPYRKDFLNYLRDAQPLPAAAAALAYDYQLFWKGYLLQNVYRQREMVRSRPELLPLWQELQELATAVYQEQLRPISQRDPERIAVLRKTIVEQERAFSRASGDFQELARPVDWREVQAALGRRSAAVEFFHAPSLTSEHPDSSFYGALVLTRDAAPVFVYVCQEGPLRALLMANDGIATGMERLYAVRGGRLLDDQPAYGEQLYDLIWRPLEGYLQGVRTVYAAPMGLLHQVNLAALPVDGAGRVLLDRHALHLVSSTRDIRNMVSYPKQPGTALLLGGLDYEKQEDVEERMPEEGEASALAWWRSAGGGQAEPWPFLPGTLAEVRQLDGRLRANGFDVETFTGLEGSEALLKHRLGAGSGSPGLLHIATHGFFFSAPDERAEGLVFQAQSDPLTRCGLILSGANPAWMGTGAGEGEDGILTAYEISRLSLGQTRLAVLSACETARGELLGSEGVYGLQRAFRIAGADQLLLSLWPVPDQATAAFMDHFYREWIRHRDAHLAYLKAVRKMRRSYRPGDWAAWVLVE